MTQVISTTLDINSIVKQVSEGSDLGQDLQHEIWLIMQLKVAKITKMTIMTEGDKADLDDELLFKVSCSED